LTVEVASRKIFHDSTDGAQTTNKLCKRPYKYPEQRIRQSIKHSPTQAVEAVQRIIDSDCRLSLRKIVHRLPSNITIGYSAVHRIVTHILKLRKVDAKWVPCLVSDESGLVKFGSKSTK